MASTARRPRVRFIIATVGLVLAGVLASSMAGATESGSYTGCYLKENGLLRVIDPSANCRPNEERITWNQQGPQGQQGERGSARAYAAVTSEGVVVWYRKLNVDSVTHLETGVYCVFVDPSIDLGTSVALANAVGGSAMPRYVSTFIGCGVGDRTGIQVNIFDGQTNAPANSDFYVSVP